MTALVWDQVGERVYQTGIDRGVLYLPDGSGVPWNGLVSVTDQPTSDLKVSYLDGVKYLETHVLGDFSAELKAYTYPDEFDDINGIVFSDGLNFHDQPVKSFGLSYRTMLGDDSSGLDRGYKIHILYNLRATPSTAAFESITNQTNGVVFSWGLSGIPAIIPGFRPTCHISIDSTKIDPYNLSVFENELYGSEINEATLPSPLELISFDDLIIIDNGDGTWQAVGPSRFITMLDATTFQLNDVDATIIDPNTYTVQSTFT